MSDQVEDNVILFPGAHKRHPPQSLDEMRLNIAERQLEIATETSLRLVRDIVDELEDCGYQIDAVPEGGLIVATLIEVMMAAMAATSNIEYPMRDAIKVLFAEKIADPVEFMDEFYRRTDNVQVIEMDGDAS